MIIDTEKLVNAEELLAALFNERGRPTLRWVRDQTARRTIPFIKIGHLVFFDVDKVREALERNRTIRARPSK